MYANGNTPDLAALTSVCERVLQQDAGRRLVVFVTDGCGDAPSVMTQAVSKYRALGVSIVAIGMGNEPACDAYPYRATVAHAGDLGSASMREVLRALADCAGSARRRHGRLAMTWLLVLVLVWFIAACGCD